MLKYKLIIIPVLLISFFSFGQVNDSGYKTKAEENTGYYLTRVNSYAEAINYSKEESYQIGFLINEAISIYIDQSYRLTTTQLIFRKSEKEIINQMNDLVNQSLDLFKIEHHFNGFSNHVAQTLGEITSITWGIDEYLLLGDDQAERDFVLANYIDHEFKKLEKECHAEVNSFIRENRIEISTDMYMDKQEELVKVSKMKYESKDFITPLEYNLDWPIAAAAFELDFVFPKSFIDGYNAYVKANEKSTKKHKKRKNDYTEELIAVIKQNSEQLSALQKDLKNYNEAGIARDHEQNYALQKQIGELQNQINDIKKQVNKQRHLIKNNETEKVAVEKTIIQFENNSTAINSFDVVKLNRVFLSLIKMPEYKVIITGYADKSGNTKNNIDLSRKRAEEVKKYLIDQGISKERLIVNYMGDINSKTENSSDRKVVIEFINKTSAIYFTVN